MDNNKLFAKDEDQSKLADFREILFTYLVYWKWFVLCAVLSVALVLNIRKQKRRPEVHRMEEPDYLKDI